MNYKLEQKAKVMVTEQLDHALYDTLKNQEWSKPLIVIDKFLLNNNRVQETLKYLKDNGVDYVIYDKITPEPPMRLIDDGANLFRDHGCDSIIAIGGGSVIDASRGINIVRTYGGRIEEYVSNTEKITDRCHGLIAIPTTSGTGSELSNALVVTDEKNQKKLAILSDEAVSEYVILDPNLPKSMPAELTIQTGLDVFSHAVEAYTSTLSTPVVDAICEKVMFLVVKYLPRAVKNGDDLEARQRMMVAAALGGWVLNNGGTHLGHSIGHIVGAKYHIPHGMACAYALPGVLYHTAFVKPKKVREIGNILGVELGDNLSSEEIGKEISKEYVYFRDKILGLKKFKEIKIETEDLLKLTEDIVNERFAQNTPFEVTTQSVSSILAIYG